MERKKEWDSLWLAYRKVDVRENERYVRSISIEGFSVENPIVKNAREEFLAGAKGMLGIQPVEQDSSCTAWEEQSGGCIFRKVQTLEAEGYRLRQEQDTVFVEASDENGLLYGVFALLRHIGMGQQLQGIEECVCPDNPLRMYNHWDNMDGSIERGYSGESFFFRRDEILINERTRDYARLMASVGINAVVINNVNVKQAATCLITDRYFEPLAELSQILASFGIRMFLSLNFAAPMELGGPQSADPLDDAVQVWWKEKMAEVFARIPNLGGFLVKADSEGRPGPFTYDRTQAQGANMLADMVRPYGGVIIWRCFVYNCTQDWRDYHTDRARAGYDNFIETDGDYRDNVILQIKNGPMDFQIREPISPLLGGLTKTNQMLEVQVAQEYTGHQIDVCYLIPMFKEILDFHTYCKDGADRVADIISGRTFGNRNCGIAAVINTGNDANWTGNVLAAANLYGFARLAYSTELSAQQIAEEWVRLQISNEPETVSKICQILMPSREVYENYTSPLGIGWMVVPHEHYGCSVDGYEYSRWGTYHRADHLGMGVDRSMKGTGYTGQYREPNASLYDDPATCPEKLLLFFHHIPYTWKLQSGKTLIQHIYDSHFLGVEQVMEMMNIWKSLEPQLEEGVYCNVWERMNRQLYNAREWRDQVNSYFYRKSGIEDEQHREIY